MIPHHPRNLHYPVPSLSRRHTMEMTLHYPVTFLSTLVWGISPYLLPLAQASGRYERPSGRKLSNPRNPEVQSKLGILSGEPLDTSVRLMHGHRMDRLLFAYIPIYWFTDYLIY